MLTSCSYNWRRRGFYNTSVTNILLTMTGVRELKTTKTYLSTTLMNNSAKYLI